jgi:hypothetical protein
MIPVCEYQATIMVAYRSIDLHIDLILALNMRGSSLLSIVPVARVRRVPPALALHSGLLQSITMRTWLGKQDINLLESTAGGLRAVVPHVRSGEETADQWPDEDLRTDGRDASAAAEDHDPGGEPLACGTKAAGDVTVAKRSNLRTCREISTS